MVDKALKSCEWVIKFNRCLRKNFDSTQKVIEKNVVIWTYEKYLCIVRLKNCLYNKFIDSHLWFWFIFLHNTTSCTCNDFNTTLMISFVQLDKTLLKKFILWLMNLITIQIGRLLFPEVSPLLTNLHSMQSHRRKWTR
jgi:hypothetical protein